MLRTEDKSISLRCYAMQIPNAIVSYQIYDCLQI